MTVLGDSTSEGSVMSRVRSLFVLIALLLLAGCGGGKPPGGAFIPGVSVQGTAIQPPTATIAVAGTQQFRAIVTLTNGQTEDVTADATWTSSSTAIATINGSGLATGVSAGVAIITASFDGFSASAKLTVTAANAPALKSIAVTPNPATVPAGQTVAFTAKGTFSDNSTQDLTTQVTWTSSNTKFATIAATGIATGVASGQLTITASMTSNGTAISGQATLTVTPSLGTRLYVTGTSPIAQPLVRTASPRQQGSFGAVVVFTLDSNGNPQTPGTAFGTGGTGVGTAVLNPAGTRLYVLNPNAPPGTSATIATFTLNSSGDITAAPTLTTVPSTVDSGAQFGLAMNAAGTLLYTTNQGDGNAFAFIVDANGDITGPSPNSPGPNSSGGPDCVALNPNDNSLYTANFGTDDLTQFVLTNGDFSPLPSVQNEFLDPNQGLLFNPVFLAMNGAGTRLYMTSDEAGVGTGELGVFDMDPNTGNVLTNGGNASTQAGSPFAAGVNPLGITLNPNGEVLYVAGAGSNGVLTFPLAANGDVSAAFTLTSTGAGTAPQFCALNPAATLLFVPDSKVTNGNFEVINVDANGNLGTVNSVALPASINAAGNAVVRP